MGGGTDGACAWSTPQALLDSTPQGGPPTEGHGQPASLGGGPGTHHRGGRTRPGEGVLQCWTCECAGHPHGPRISFCLPTLTGRAPGVSAQLLWSIPLRTEPFQGVGLATGTEHICFSEWKCGVAQRGGCCLFRPTEGKIAWKAPSRARRVGTQHAGPTRKAGGG